MRLVYALRTATGRFLYLLVCTIMVDTRYQLHARQHVSHTLRLHAVAAGHLRCAVLHTRCRRLAFHSLLRCQHTALVGTIHHIAFDCLERFLFYSCVESRLPHHGYYTLPPPQHPAPHVGSHTLRCLATPTPLTCSPPVCVCRFLTRVPCASPLHTSLRV